MSENSTPAPLTLERDGASQSQRHLSGLDPETVGIDERGIKDWLAFAHAYSRKLTYYNLDNQPSDDWSKFLNAANLDGKDRRPHFVLFLAFLHLLRLSQGRLNRLTREHLDFYYRKFLSLEKQGAQPDRVNILATLSPGVAQALLPQGTLLDAGKDSLGEGLFYRTDEDLIVNRAQVKSLYSVFVDKKVTGIRQAREESVETQADPLLAMFRIVYGEPTAGDPLPLYNEKLEVNDNLLNRLRDLVNFVISKAEVGAIFTIQSPDSPNFDDNLKKDLGNKELDFSSFRDLVDTNNLDSLSAALQRVRAYFYCSLKDFALLMDVGTREKQTDFLKKPTPAEWDRVYAILAKAYAQKVYAGRRKKLSDLIGDGKPPQKDRLEAMLRLILGGTVLAADGLLRRLELYWPKEYEKALEQIKNGMKNESVSDFGKEDVVAGLELVWRNRKGVEPVAQKVEWLNLYATEDITSVKVADLSGTPRWRTFGQGRQALTKNQQPAHLLGWAIASPVFCLSQGERTIILTLVFKPDGYDSAKINELLKNKDKDSAANCPFQVEASSEKGWIVGRPTIESVDYFASEIKFKALKLKLVFDVSTPPIAALPDGESRWPIVRLLLRSGYMAHYPLFQALVLERVLIEATVKGLKDLRLENDNGPIQAGKPFEPFGFSPAVGSSFQFVHPELVVKRLDRLTLNLQWMKLPTDNNWANYYKNYPEISKDRSFTAKIDLVDHQSNKELVKNAALFKEDKAIDSQEITLAKKGKATDQDITAEEINQPPDYASFNLADPSSWPRYWRLKLNSPDFQHGNYAGVSAAQSIALATAIAASLKPGSTTTPSAANYQVNPPTPPPSNLSAWITGARWKSLWLRVICKFTAKARSGFITSTPLGWRKSSPNWTRGCIPSCRFTPTKGSCTSAWKALRHRRIWRCCSRWPKAAPTPIWSRSRWNGAI